MLLYLGTFLIALATLALEVTLTRLLSVITWYHLAFFCIGTAMLGMTAGATTVYLRPRWFERDGGVLAAARASVAASAATVVALVLVCVLPVLVWVDVMSFLVTLVATLACALPFYFAGIAITLALTRFPLPPGRIYAADLVGASLGCVLVLVGLAVVDAPTLVLVCGALAIAAALAFGGASPTFSRRAAAAYLAVYVLAIAGNLSSSERIHPVFVKGKMELGNPYFFEDWNTFSRIAVRRRTDMAPTYWGASPNAPRGPVLPRFRMSIDGEAGTIVAPFRTPQDINYLRFDVTNVAHYLRPRGNVAVLGVGGGRDIQSALLFGHERVVGVELNPIFVHLLEGVFRKFAGIAGRDDVTLVNDEARSYMSRTPERFSLIQMSLTDTWASTGAGAFSLSENALYTVEAWKVFLGRLRPDGLFSVSRWYAPDNPGETGRLLSLAVASLFELGVEDPSRHLALVTSGHAATLIVSRAPFDIDEVARLESVAEELGYGLPVIPGRAVEHPVLAKIVGAHSIADLYQRVRDEPLDYEPATDEQPYFFNMLRLGSLGDSLPPTRGIVAGNQTALRSLVALLATLGVLCVLTILVPLFAAGRSAPILWPGAIYFAAIGAGFMLVEIGLIQRLSVFLGHPVYALGILLFTVIASTGVGSYLSEFLPLARRPWLALFPPATAAAIAAMRFALPGVIAAAITEPLPVRIAISIAAVSPLGVLLGFFFPTGMRLARSLRQQETAWYWALNGVFGVLCSALAVLLSIYVGIAATFYAAAGCYALTLPCLLAIDRARGATS